jgi:hypothetical protein
LDKSEFERALKLGLGRAVLHVKAHPDVPYRDAILDVCLHSPAYDLQIEGTRAMYAYEVIRSANDYTWYREQILTALVESPPSDDWDQGHLMAMARQMAVDGDQEAREKLYGKVRVNAEAGYDNYVDEVVALDGAQGLALIASLPPIVGHSWAYESYASWLIEDFPEQANEETLRSILSEYPEFLEPLLEALRDRNDPTREERKRAESQTHQEARRAELAISYADFKQRLDEGADRRYRSRFGLARPWGIHASDEDIQLAALDLEAEQDQARLNTLLGIFNKRKYPLGPEHLLEIASQYLPSIEERNDSGRPTLEASLAMGALNTLSHAQHASVRQFALSLLDQANLLYWAVKILSENFEAGDWQVITSLTGQHKIDQEDYHSLGMGVRTMFESHPHPDAIPALLTLYEYGPCSFCRHFVVENLHSLNALPDWMIRECAHDSYSDTREFIETLLEKPG